MDVIDWLLTSGEPWTRYRTLVDLLGRGEDDPDVRDAREKMVAHAQVQALVELASQRPERPIKRHNDAGHPLVALSTLADFGIKAGDPGMGPVVAAILDHQSEQGAFQSKVNVAKAFGGSGEDEWAWMACDAPVLVSVLVAIGLGDHPRTQAAVDHLLTLGGQAGWECSASPNLGKFRGPGRRGDPCPIVNVYALKALSFRPDLHEHLAVKAGIEMLLSHWASPGGKKHYLFGVGTDYRKLKYPLLWYDILHTAETLSRFPTVKADERFQSMAAAIRAQADPDGRFTAGSMYRPWKGWSFANKKEPSPWLTLLALRICR